MNLRSTSLGIFTAVALVVAFTSAAHAGLIAYYVNGSSADAAAMANLTSPSGYTASSLSSTGLRAAVDYTSNNGTGFGPTTPAGPTAGSSAGSEWLVATCDTVSSSPVSTDDYYQFTVAGTGGNTIDPTSLTFDWQGWVHSATGTVTFTYQLFASTDGSTFSAVGSAGSKTITNPLAGVDTVTAVTTENIDLTSLAAAGSYTFRIALGDNSSSNKKGNFFQAIQLNAEVTPAPEPASLMLMGLGGLMIAKRRRA